MNNKTEKSKTEKRTRTRPFVCVAITLSLAIGICCGKLVHTPTNTTVSVGNRAVLQCQTDQPLTVFWYFNDKEIFYGGRISLEYSSKFDIETGSTSNGNYYNLVIPSADTWYNGRYTCGDDEGQGEKQSAWLTVTDSPTTVESVSLPNTDASKQTITIGVAVGVIVFAIVVVGIVILVLYCLSKRRRENRNTEAPLIVKKEEALPTQRNNRNKYEVVVTSKSTGTVQEPKIRAQGVVIEEPIDYDKARELFQGKPANSKSPEQEGKEIPPTSEGEKSETSIGKNVSAESVVAARNDPPPPENVESYSKHTEDDTMLDKDDSESGLLQNQTSEQTNGAEDINGKKEGTTDKEKDENALLLPANTTSDKDNSSGT